ncbi:ubiquitin-associated protein 1-like isoform X1 [Ptychodera flava]|uniref:ubiquitin-associated protein 1-like isoform X1 n=1 Tax=Ptychodera flava TaxID=63121 RepID=UPI00396A6952
MAYPRKELVERSVSVPYINYLDGVEFKVGDRFRMPTRVSLPVNYHQKDPSDILSREYDFSVENEVIRWAEERRRAESAREAEKQARREAQAHVASLGVANSAVQGDLDVLASANDSRVLRPQIAPVVANMSTEVLQPVPTSQASQAQNYPNVSRPNTIDITDFEVVASDPFEATELKSLNEMEELSRVLQSSYPNSVQTVVNGVQTNQNSSAGMNHGERAGQNSAAGMSHGVQASQNSTVGMNHDHVTDSAESTVSIQASTGRVSFTPDRINSNPENNISLPHPVPNGPVPNSSPMNTRVNGPSSSCDYNVVSRPMSRNTPLPPIPSARPASVNYDDYNSVNDSSRSTSMPNIVRQVNFSSEPNYASFPDSFHTANDFTAVPARAATPPPPYQESTDSSLNRFTPLPPSPNQNYLRPIGDPPAYTETDSRLPNPYNVMPLKEKQFIDGITGMGFPQDRTARAVQRLGEDDKQVIDTLCAIEKLVGQGYREERVEMALNYSDDEQQAVEFLKLMRQFEELGFKQDDITRQLILHGNNQEKVLDGLTA